jgi:hypothetical protein
MEVILQGDELKLQVTEGRKDESLRGIDSERQR